MFRSTIIPTIGRPTLARAVDSVLSQEPEASDFEILVVNDSGQPLPEADWQRSERVQVINTNRHNRCVARNAGAAVARGQYLHFLDDDDWMLPGALQSLRELAATRPAAWLYGGFQLVDNTGRIIAEICPEEEGNCFVQLIASEWIPLQASLIESRAFFAVGGFAPLPSLLGGYEDIDLSRQIVLKFDMARSPCIVTRIRFGDQGSTTNYGDMFAQDRQSRDDALSRTGAFRRLHASARASQTNNAYWHGRVVYYYLAGMRWSWQHRRFFTAVSRGAHASVGLAVAGKHLFSRAFWQALEKPHFNRVRQAFEGSKETWFTRTKWH